jgi:hypothetical protein
MQCDYFLICGDQDKWPYLAVSVETLPTWSASFPCLYPMPLEAGLHFRPLI